MNKITIGQYGMYASITTISSTYNMFENKQKREYMMMNYCGAISLKVEISGWTRVGCKNGTTSIGMDHVGSYGGQRELSAILAKDDQELPYLMVSNIRRV